MEHNGSITYFCRARLKLKTILMPIIQNTANAGESDCCLTPSNHFSAISWGEQEIFNEMMRSTL